MWNFDVVYDVDPSRVLNKQTIHMCDLLRRNIGSGVWRYQAIPWQNIDLSSMVLCGTHPGPILQEVCKIPHISQAKELKSCSRVLMADFPGRLF